jgi:carbamoyltransferase
MNQRYYIGLSATLHDPAIAIIGPTGEVLFAEATERSLQDKRAFNAPPDQLIRLPQLLEEFCPDADEISVVLNWSASFRDRLRLHAACDLPVLRQLARPARDRLLGLRDHVIWPLPGFRNLVDSLATSATRAGRNMNWIDVVPKGYESRGYDHHLTHAATGCYSSPFSEALCAVVDGFGEWSSVAFYHFREGRLRRLDTAGPWRGLRTASLGMFYGMLCGLCGFDPLKGEEWKVMGLAAYGKRDEAIHDLLAPLLEVEGLNLVTGCSRSEYRRRLSAVQKLMTDAASSSARADLAHTGQVIFGDSMCQLLGNLHATGLSTDLVLSGGCALNSSWNGRILAETPFERLHVPYAPADDGTALGAALLAWAEDHPGSVPRARADSPYLGSRLSRKTLTRLPNSAGQMHLEHLPEQITSRTAALLAAGKIVGWVQGRAEFGPRALGNRSILADPRLPDIKDRINAKIKFREEFRPFAPAILDAHGADYFTNYQSSPYMERTLRFAESKRERVPGVVHVDGTGRLQSVRENLNPKFHRLIADFHEISGVPLLLNTSFNVMGKPIVHSVEDALGAFFTTGLDALVLEDFLIQKEAE